MIFARLSWAVLCFVELYEGQAYGLNLGVKEKQTIRRVKLFIFKCSKDSNSLQLHTASKSSYSRDSHLTLIFIYVPEWETLVIIVPPTNSFPSCSPSDLWKILLFYFLFYITCIKWWQLFLHKTWTALSQKWKII